MPKKYVRKTPISVYAVIDEQGNTEYIGRAADIAKHYYTCTNAVYQCLYGKYKMLRQYTVRRANETEKNIFFETRLSLTERKCK